MSSSFAFGPHWVRTLMICEWLAISLVIRSELYGALVSEKSYTPTAEVSSFLVSFVSSVQLDCSCILLDIPLAGEFDRRGRRRPGVDS